MGQSQGIAIKDLQETYLASRGELYKSGHSEGYSWAMEYASIGDLEFLELAFVTSSHPLSYHEGWKRFTASHLLGEGLNDATAAQYTLAERLFFIMRHKRRGDRPGAAEFWKRTLLNLDPSLEWENEWESNISDPEWLHGFTDGALEMLWDASETGTKTWQRRECLEQFRKGMKGETNAHNAESL
jgi:hypothetical protein